MGAKEAKPSKDIFPLNPTSKEALPFSVRKPPSSQPQSPAPRSEAKKLDLWNSSSQPFRESIVLIWTWRTAVPLQKLSKNVIRVVSEYVSEYTFLVRIKNDELRCFDIHKCEWKPLCYLSQDLSAIYRLCYSIAQIDTISLVVCGGMSFNTSAHFVEGGSVSALGDMKKGRYSHAAAYVRQRNAVFVFGGANAGSIRSCEALDLNARKWTSSGKMNHTRAGFNACLYGSQVLLCGGDLDGSVESFDWTSTAFTLFATISLPPMAKCVTVAVRTGCILCITEKCNYRWDIQTKAILDVIEHEHYQIEGCTTAKVIGDLLYIVEGTLCTYYTAMEGLIIGSSQDSINWS